MISPSQVQLAAHCAAAPGAVTKARHGAVVQDNNGQVCYVGAFACL